MAKGKVMSRRFLFSEEELEGYKQDIRQKALQEALSALDPLTGSGDQYSAKDAVRAILGLLNAT